jgi:hypothetical protein
LAFRSRMVGAQKIEDIMKEKHPEEPHWYLWMQPLCNWLHLAF